MAHNCTDCGDPCDCGGFDEVSCLMCAWCNCVAEDMEEIETLNDEEDEDDD